MTVETKSDRRTGQPTPASEASGPAAAPIDRARIRGRVIVLGIFMAALTSVLVTYAELVVSSIRIGYLQFPPVAIGLMFVMAITKRSMSALTRRSGLTGSDLLIVYCMMLVAAMVSSHGVVQKWIPLLVVPNYFATTTNNWHGLFDPSIKPGLTPYDPRLPGQQAVSTAYFNGLGHGQAIPWSLWIAPLANWGVLIVLVLTSFLCLASILRRQWVDNEKLAVPLAQLPLEIAGEVDSGFFRNRMMWLGALIPTVVFALKECHQLVPAVPDIVLTVPLNEFFTTAPWNGLAYTPLTLSFAAIGFFFLLPADILFSIWFFFALARLEEVAMIAYNIPTPGMPMFPLKLFLGYQSIGAYFVLVGYLVWIARPHLRRVWASAIGRERVDDSAEMLPYRVAVWGLIATVLGSALWLWGMGMSLWLALLEIVVFVFVIAVVMARSTAEAGMLMTETVFRPIDIYRMFGSIHALGPANLTMLAFVDNLLLRDQRGLLLTGFVDSLRIADGTRVPRRAFAGILALGVLVSTVVAVALNIGLPYTHGALQLDSYMEQVSPSLTWNDYASYMHAADHPSSAWQMPVFFSVGIVVSLCLTVMRSAFHWWPLQDRAHLDAKRDA